MNQLILHVLALTCIKKALVQHLPKGGFQIRQEFRVESNWQFGRVFLHLRNFFTVFEYDVHQTCDIVVSAMYCAMRGVLMQIHKAIISCQSSETLGHPVSLSICAILATWPSFVVAIQSCDRLTHGCRLAPSFRSRRRHEDGNPARKEARSALA